MPFTDPKSYLKLIHEIKQDLKKDLVVIEMCKKNKFEVKDIDLVPIKFGDIDVSANTNQGVVTISNKLLENLDKEYLKGIITHEIFHYASQSRQPTQSADDGDYLENPEELNAFQYQMEFISENEGKEKAKEYADQVLDHHGEKGEERREKKENLLKKVEEFRNCLKLRK